MHKHLLTLSSLAIALIIASVQMIQTTPAQASLSVTTSCSPTELSGPPGGTTYPFTCNVSVSNPDLSIILVAIDCFDPTNTVSCRFTTDQQTACPPPVAGEDYTFNGIASINSQAVIGTTIDFEVWGIVFGAEQPGGSCISRGLPVIHKIPMKLNVTGTSQADLSVSKTDTPDPVEVRSSLTYEITVANLGPSSATEVTLVDKLLEGSVTFSSVTSSQGACSQSGSTITCNLGTLASGSEATVTIVVIPTAEGTIINTARSMASESDVNRTNNSATTVTTVNPAFIFFILHDPNTWPLFRNNEFVHELGASDVTDQMIKAQNEFSTGINTATVNDDNFEFKMKQPGDKVFTLHNNDEIEYELFSFRDSNDRIAVKIYPLIDGKRVPKKQGTYVFKIWNDNDDDDPFSSPEDSGVRDYAGNLLDLIPNTQKPEEFVQIEVKFKVEDGILKLDGVPQVKEITERKYDRNR